jgi:hypothetical protein
VYKQGERYTANIWFDGTQHYIGYFKTKKQAGIAYDRVAIGKSNEKVFYVLNYPNMPQQEKKKATSDQKRDVTRSISSSSSFHKTRKKPPSKQQQKTKSASKIMFEDVHNDECSECGYGGDLLCCDYCNLVYHEGCLSTHARPYEDESIKWACPACTKEQEE